LSFPSRHKQNVLLKTKNEKWYFHSLKKQRGVPFGFAKISTLLSKDITDKKGKVLQERKIDRRRKKWEKVDEKKLFVRGRKN
jgi:hypothetical protein